MKNFIKLVQKKTKKSPFLDVWKLKKNCCLHLLAFKITLKFSRWWFDHKKIIKILKVCREFVRGACKRAESECRFAHPKEGVIQLDDGSVTVCMDAIKGRCSRSPCRYFHPPLHLQAQIKAAQSRAVIAEKYFFNF